MKILVLMPLDEKYVYAATGIYKSLSKEMKDITFAMPMFMQYAISTKISPDWVYAAFDTIVSAESIYKTASANKDGDLIIIGNIDKKYEFDAVFNFQDIEDDSLEYKDYFIEKVKDVVKDSEILLSKINNLHDASESKMSLKDCKATAHFLENYIKAKAKVEVS